MSSVDVLGIMTRDKATHEVFVNACEYISSICMFVGSWVGANSAYMDGDA